MPRVIHFEIGAEQPERAIKFYRDVFGWKIEKWDGPMDYWLVTTGERTEPGIDGAIQQRPEPGFTTVNTVGVISLEDSVTRITAAGGKVLQPKMPIPGQGYFALCQDTECNKFGLMQADTSVT